MFLFYVFLRFINIKDYKNNYKNMIDLKKYGDHFSLLAIAPVENLQKEMCSIIKQFNNIPYIYITLNKPYTTVKNILKKFEYMQ